MSWPDVLPYSYIGLGVAAFCAALGWKHAVRYVRWVNEQMFLGSWLKTRHHGFRTGGYTGTPWYETAEHRNTELAWVAVGADYRGDLLSRGLCSMEYMVGRAGNMAMHYLVRGSRPEGRYSAEFSVTFETMEMCSSHLEVVLSSVSRYIEPRASTTASDRLSAPQHDRSYNNVPPGAVAHVVAPNGVRVYDAEVNPRTPPEEHTNKPRRLRIRKTK